MTSQPTLRLVEPWTGQDAAAPDAPPHESERPETAGAQTLRRGLAVLRLLTRVGPGGLRMGEIGHRLGLNKTTAIRLTRTLVAAGYLFGNVPLVRDHMSSIVLLGVGLGVGSLLVSAVWRFVNRRWRAR